LFGFSWMAINLLLSKVFVGYVKIALMLMNGKS